MDTWRISDKRVVEAIRANGFICEKPKIRTIPAAISFHTRPIEEERAAEEASAWYETDCPIKWGKNYTLPDGTVIRPSGTSVTLG